MEKLRARDYRIAAKNKCSKYSDTLALIYVLHAIITAAVAGASFGLLAILVTGPLALGIAMICEEVDQERPLNVEKLFAGFNNFGRAFVLELLTGIYLFLWSLLIIPVFIKIYSYSMSVYILKDNPDMSADECITMSRKIMNGHKWELFCLEFSYIGWIILCILTFGILSFWVSPKMQQAKYLFYLHITEKDSQVIEEY
ncbi:DUF975 family protein [bacterium]|nr:DUF975 family protein [bacterium]